MQNRKYFFLNLLLNTVVAADIYPDENIWKFLLHSWFSSDQNNSSAAVALNALYYFASND